MFFFLRIPTGAALVLVGTTQKKLGQFEKEFLQTAVTSFNNPLHNFLDNDMKTITVRSLGSCLC